MSTATTDPQGELNTDMVRRLDALEIKVGLLSKIVFGAVGLILITVLAALIAVVIVKPGQTAAVTVQPTNVQNIPKAPANPQ